MMKDICVFFGTGYEEIEALTVVDILRRAGIPTKMVSITGEDMVTGSHNISVKMDAKFEEIDFEQVEMIVLPGGMPGTKNLEAHEGLMAKLDEFYAAGKPVSAICAAPSIFGHRDMLQGKKACCYPSFEEDLKGAEVVFDSCVVTDNVTTARGMGAAIDFALAILARYQGKEAAKEMADKIIY